MSGVSPQVADRVDHVGQPAILESVHVSQGPGRIASAPIPSVFTDDRGSIHRLRVGRQRVNLLCSRAECMRSGYLNSVRTHDMVLQGRVEVWRLTSEGTDKQIYKAQDVFTIDPYVPHIMYFLEDETNLVEWYEGTFECWFYRPYRNIVNVQNSLMETQSSSAMPHSPARQSRLVREFVERTSASNNGSSWGRSLQLVLFTSTAWAVGCLVGAYLASNSKNSIRLGSISGGRGNG